MRFEKWHGIGNDFVMLVDPDAAMGPVGELPPALVVALCDRHTGVGADGVIRIVATGSPHDAGVTMDYYNADGDAAEMCGNGIRCLALLARREGLLPASEEHLVATGAGVKVVRIVDADRVTVDMGRPRTERADVPMAGSGSAVDATVETDGRAVVGTGVSMGNPHFVLFLDDLGEPLSDDLVTAIGPRLERHPDFPRRANVEFVDVVSPTELRVRVWERGVGETQACGTGACAVAVAGALTGRAQRAVTVRLPGGALDVEWAPDDRVWMTGPAEEVFAGELSDGWLRRRGLAVPTAVGSRETGAT